jgi:hypothetical protein
MATTKRQQKRPRLTKGWEVEWCAGCPVRDGDTMLDEADMRFEDFPTKEPAMKRAQEILDSGKDFFGCVRVTEFEYVPYEPGYPGTYREHIGEPEYVDEPSKAA